MKAYYVKYRLNRNSKVKGIGFLAKTKADAYDKAVYELIPEANDGETPYSAWVHSVTYNNGNVHYFNTSEAMPY